MARINYVVNLWQAENEDPGLMTNTIRKILFQSTAETFTIDKNIAVDQNKDPKSYRDKPLNGLW